MNNRELLTIIKIVLHIKTLRIAKQKKKKKKKRGKIERRTDNYKYANTKGGSKRLSRLDDKVVGGSRWLTDKISTSDASYEIRIEHYVICEERSPTKILGNWMVDRSRRRMKNPWNMIIKFILFFPPA